MNAAQWKEYRKTWTKVRDEAKIAKGAVSGVSVGDLIEGVAKAHEKGILAVRAAVAKLLAGTKKYKAGIAPKKTKLPTWIDANLEKEAKELDAHCVAAIAQYERIIGQAVEAETRLSAVQPGTYFLDADKAAEKKQVTWMSLVKDNLAKYLAVGTTFKTVSQSVTIAVTAIKVQAAGKVAPKETLEWAANQMKEIGEACVVLSKSQGGVQFMENFRATAPSFPQRPSEFSEELKKTAKEQGAMA